LTLDVLHVVSIIQQQQDSQYHYLMLLKNNHISNKNIINQNQTAHLCLKHAQLDTDSNGKAGLGCLSNGDYIISF